MRRFTSKEAGHIVTSDMAYRDSKSITIGELTFTSPPEEIAEARALLLEYGRFVIAQPGAARFCFGSLENEAQRLPTSYLELGGGCLLARTNGLAAGFVAWREISQNVTPNLPDVPVAWELKRLWVRPEARSLGLGRMLTQAVLDRARKAGCGSIYLDTAPQSMGSAYRLYLTLGFVPCDKYNENPVEGLAYLVKRL